MASAAALAAATCGDLASLSTLVKPGAPVSPLLLHASVSGGHEPCAALLLQRGASETEKDASGKTALELAEALQPSNPALLALLRAAPGLRGKRFARLDGQIEEAVAAAEEAKEKPLTKWEVAFFSTTTLLFVLLFVCMWLVSSEKRARALLGKAAYELLSSSPPVRFIRAKMEGAAAPPPPSAQAHSFAKVDL